MGEGGIDDENDDENEDDDDDENEDDDDDENEDDDDDENEDENEEDRQNSANLCLAKGSAIDMFCVLLKQICQ